MPMDKKRYPRNWSEISRATRERAGWKCEQCGAPNGEYIVRGKGAAWRLLELADEGRHVKAVRVVLTVHHAGVPKPDGTPGDRHDKMDVRPENLQALCQRCHLLADLDIHMENRKRTLAARKRRGQLNLFEETTP